MIERRSIHKVSQGFGNIEDPKYRRSEKLLILQRTVPTHVKENIVRYAVGDKQ